MNAADELVFLLDCDNTLLAFAERRSGQLCTFRNSPGVHL